MKHTKRILFNAAGILLATLIMSFFDMSHDVSFRSVIDILLNFLVVMPKFFFNLALWIVVLSPASLIIGGLLYYNRPQEHYIAMLETKEEIRVQRMLTFIRYYTNTLLILFVCVTAWRILDFFT